MITARTRKNFFCPVIIPRACARGNVIGFVCRLSPTKIGETGDKATSHTISGLLGCLCMVPLSFTGGVMGWVSGINN